MVGIETRADFDDLFVFRGCGHEPREGFVYPVISHAGLTNCGAKLAVRILKADGSTRCASISASRLVRMIEDA